MNRRNSDDRQQLTGKANEDVRGAVPSNSSVEKHE